MARPAIKKDTIKAQTVVDMKSMGTYRREYDPLIDLYAGLREQYERLNQEYAKGKSYNYATTTADGGAKKSPLSLTLESLRKDILAYSDRLMLNPKARADNGTKKPEKKSKLMEALSRGP